MKLLSQIIAFFLVGTNSMQIILTIGTSVIVIEMLLTRLLEARSRWIIRKKKRAFEIDMWSIN